jgi:hypothetical protein
MPIDDPNTWPQGAAAFKSIFEGLRSAIGALRDLRGSADTPSREGELIDAALEGIAGSLAAAAFTPNDIPQAVPSASSSAALRAAIGRLAEAHATLVTAQAAEEEANAMFMDWLAQTPEPKTKKGRRRPGRKSHLPLGLIL